MFSLILQNGSCLSTSQSQAGQFLYVVSRLSVTLKMDAVHSIQEARANVTQLVSSSETAVLII